MKESPTMRSICKKGILQPPISFWHLIKCMQKIKKYEQNNKLKRLKPQNAPDSKTPDPRRGSGETHWPRCESRRTQAAPWICRDPRWLWLISSKYLHFQPNSTGKHRKMQTQHQKSIIMPQQLILMPQNLFWIQN